MKQDLARLQHDKDTTILKKDLSKAWADAAIIKEEDSWASLVKQKEDHDRKNSVMCDWEARDG